MYELAKKIIRAGDKLSTGGRALTPLEIRVGMWPCVSQDEPRAAVGIMAALAALLERWQEITVYRVFAWLDGEPNNYQWSLERSQFTPDDWAFDGLNDNVGIWGELLRDGAEGWILKLSVENDLLDAEGRDPIQMFEFSAESLSALVNKLPAISIEIAKSLGLAISANRKTAYMINARSESALRNLLEAGFAWELQLLFNLWGTQTLLNASHKVLIESGRALGDDFAGWYVSTLSERALLPEQERAADEMLPLATIADSFTDSMWAQLIIGRAQFNSGLVQEGLQRIITLTRHQPQFADAWVTLALMYSRSSRVRDAISVLQMAIKQGITSQAIYAGYAQFCVAVDRQSLKINDFVLINPSEYPLRPTAWEAVESYGLAAEEDENRAQYLFNQVALLVTLDDYDVLWKVFAALVNADATGESVRNAIDELYALDDITPATKTLADATKQHPERVDLKLNLAAAYIANEEGARAGAVLNAVNHDSLLTEQAQEFDRLRLIAQNPDFEATLGEIIDKIAAQTALSEDEVDFLEEAVQSAPYYSEPYLLLARAYLLWEDDGAALEVLLDAEKLIDDPDIIELLAEQLRASGQNDLALQYVERGLRKNMLHVPLLSLAGQLLAEHEAYEDAREYLMRAEVISPNSPALQKAREYIAQLMQE